MLTLYGTQIVTDPLLVETRQFRFPRSKKNRIRNKWKKDRRNWKSLPSSKVMQMAGIMIMHPTTFERLRKAQRGEIAKSFSMRGIPLLASTLRNAADLNNYDDRVMDAARAAADGANWIW